MYRLFSRLCSAFRSLFGLSGKIPDEVTIQDVATPGVTIPDGMTIPEVIIPGVTTSGAGITPDGVIIPGEIAIPGEVTTPEMTPSGEGTLSDEVITPGDLTNITPVSEPALSNWTTEHVNAGSFEKVGRIAMCPDGLEIHSDLDERVFILLNEDVDAVLDGDKRNIRLLNASDMAGSARLSASGRALNMAISPFYYTVPLRSVLAVLDGRNRKGAVFVGK